MFDHKLCCPLVGGTLRLDVHAVLVVAFLELAAIDLHRGQVAGCHAGRKRWYATRAGRHATLLVYDVVLSLAYFSGTEASQRVDRVKPSIE